MINLASVIKLMIVDDHTDMRRMLKSLISMQYTEFVDIKECETGELAVTEFASYRPDIIFMDIELKQMNGFEAIEEIYKMDAQACIIVITSHDSHFFRQRAKDLNTKGFVCKDQIADLTPILQSLTNN
jgi:DNA-binding NarL/FixJ family response regulator